MVTIISAQEAAALLAPGDAVMVGGFLMCGRPINIIDAVAERGTTELTLISNDSCVTGQCLSKLIANRQVKHLLATHIGTNPETGRQMQAGELEVTLIPQGTLAERIRAAGAGLGGVLTPTGVGTVVAEGKQLIEVDGKAYLLETALHARIAYIRAKKADKEGNLVFHGSTRNFNALMPAAAQIVVAEVEEIVEIGAIDPDHVVVPGIFVDYLVQA